MRSIYQVSIFIILTMLTSCSKEDGQPVTDIQTDQEVIPIPTSASYKIIITGKWMSPQHTVPAGNHFTRFNGLVHNTDAYMFRLGTLASTGVKNVAEVGNNIVLISEMDSLINLGKALGKFFILLPNITGSDSATLNLSVQYPLVSFESMIAPSPDWFVGLDSYSLIQNGKWVEDISIDVPGYDAGTEEGDVFGYNNPATIPQQNISFLTPWNASVIANGNSTVAPFITVRFIKQ